MAIPTNQTAGTATVMTLPYTATQIDIDLATPTPACEVWYRYTAVTGDNVLGFWAYWSGSAVNYNPQIDVFNNAFGGTFGFVSTVNRPVQFAVTPGTTYYIRMKNATANVPSAGTTLDVSLLAAPNVTAPAGSILVNDDTSGFPAVVLSGTTGEPLFFNQHIVAGEPGDVLNDGTVILEDMTDGTLHLYNSQLAPIAISNYVKVNFTQVRSHLPSNKWYVSDAGNGPTDATVTTVSAAGLVGPTTWTMPGAGLTGLAVNTAETILYYTGQGGLTNIPIQRWDLVGNLPLSNLAAGVALYDSRELLVLPDDTILALYHKSLTLPRAVQVIRYNAAGATLNTYTLGQPSVVVPRLGAAIDGTSFWVMYQDGVTPQIEHFKNVRVSDGVLLHDLTSTIYEGGVYQGAITATPEDRFGNSFSCPFVILRAEAFPPGSGIAAGSEIEVLIPRRLRRAPHLSTEQLWNFYHQFQLDLETGLGATTGQGVDPQIMLRYSDDGGHTWSHEIMVSAGPLGQYKRRAIWRRLGRSRDRIFEISFSEPTRFRLVNAYLQVTGGIS